MQVSGCLTSDAGGARASRVRGRTRDSERHGYPYAIVWTPIHPITWILPFVGHMGICDSDGVIHDWGGGPVNQDSMMFGNPTRYLRLRTPKPDQNEVRDGSMANTWNGAVREADEDFLQRTHCMMCGSDCHS